MKTQLKVNRISATMLNKLSEVCEWELDGDHIIEDGDEFSAIRPVVVVRPLSVRPVIRLNITCKTSCSRLFS